jgi:hypothetical protein
MVEQNKLIEFKGVLTFDIIAVLINELKKIMDENHENVNIYKRILIIMVETLENMCKYTVNNKEIEDIENKFSSAFTLIKKEDNYFITTGNIIRKEDQNKLEERILLINELDTLGLRKLYRKTISDGKFNSEGGAGLGFIEIAKSTRSQINFNFIQVNSKNVYFTLNLEITI